MTPMTSLSFPPTSCPVGAGGVRSDYELFKGVYNTLSQRILQTAGPILRTLREYGISSSFDWRKVSSHLREVFSAILSSDPELFQLTFHEVPQPKLTIMASILMGLGVEPQRAESTAKTLLQSHRALVERCRTTGDCAPFKVGGSAQIIYENRPGFWTPLYNLSEELKRSSRIYDGIVTLEQLARQPFKGSVYAPQAGIDQAVELMKRFPAFLGQVYKEAGLCGVHGFPPSVSPGTSPSSDDARFVAAFQEKIDADWWSNLAVTTGLTVLAIVASAATGGLAGIAIGVGFSFVTGGYAVHEANSALRQGQASEHMGGMTQAQVQHLEGELQGAFASLVINTISAGVLAKYGGTTWYEGMARGAVLTAFGSGLGAAMNPNVWNHPTREALILKAFSIGMLQGAIFGGLDKGLPNVIGPNTPFQLALRRGSHLKVGNTALVSAGKNTTPVEVKITNVDAATGRVTLEAADGGMIELQMTGSPIEVLITPQN